jgi:hypothetical protein
MTAKIGKTFTLQYVIHTLAHWRNIQSLSRLADSLSGHAVGRIGLPINLRDNVFLLGRSRS